MTLPASPSYAVIFTSLKHADALGYDEMAAEMLKLASRQEGFLGVESVRGSDGKGITVSYWRTGDAIEAWKKDAAHLAAQKLGQEQWYARYRVLVCKVEREYEGRPRSTGPLLVERLRLVRPSMALKDGYLAGLREFRAEGLPWHLELDPERTAMDFERFVQNELAKETRETAVLVPETQLWAEIDGEYVGRLSIRHRLNDALRQVGGHIGYDTRPPFRGRGAASAMLKAALPIARELGLSRVLLTCDDTNLPSIRVIERNGGVLEGIRSIDPVRPLKRYYWIELKSEGEEVTP